MTTVTDHVDTYRGWWRHVTVCCTCGWVSQGHRNRGDAYHTWLIHAWAREPQWRTSEPRGE